MSGVRTPARVVLMLCAVALGGCCCQQKGYILRGDIALELNRVSHLVGRYDDYELDSSGCDCATCAGGGWGDGGGGSGSSLEGPEPRLHPVPTRPVFSPKRTGPTPAAPLEEVTSPLDEPSSGVPTGQRQHRYGTTTPRGVRPLNTAQVVGLELNPADRPTRRRTLESIESARAGK